MSKVKLVFSMILGIFLIGVAIVMFLHDAEYILTGKTVNLNQILENGGEPPRDKFVTYECTACLGNYAETKSYAGFIPLPGKTEQFAILAENDMILSAEIGRKANVLALRQQAEEYFADEVITPVVLTGSFEVIGADMDKYLKSYFEDMDPEEYGITLTYYCIDTTKTRLKQALLYSLFLLLGGAVFGFSLKRFREE